MQVNLAFLNSYLDTMSEALKEDDFTRFSEQVALFDNAIKEVFEIVNSFSNEEQQLLTSLALRFDQIIEQTEAQKQTVKKDILKFRQNQNKLAKYSR